MSHKISSMHELYQAWRAERGQNEKMALNGAVLRTKMHEVRTFLAMLLNERRSAICRPGILLNGKRMREHRNQ